MNGRRRPASPTTVLALVVGVSVGLPGCSRDIGPSPVEGAIFSDLGTFSGLPRSPRAGASDAFWAHWGDGRAELSGYRATVSRYGAPREAELSLIYVTEPHDRRTWIKDDRVEAPNRVEVLKLIRSEHFLTGIYPYSVMASVFAPVEPWGGERFGPIRINLDVQEWCGAVTHRLWPGPSSVRSLRLSYFEWEGETLDEIPIPEGTLYEDALLIQLRELDGVFNDGEVWEGWLFPELWRLRNRGVSVEPERASITRATAERDGVPVHRFRVESEGYWRTIDVESEPPQRILGWENSVGDTAELIGSERLAYWSLNSPGDESYREALGLSPLGLLPSANAGGACAVGPT